MSVLWLLPLACRAPAPAEPPQDLTLPTMAVVEPEPTLAIAKPAPVVSLDPMGALAILPQDFDWALSMDLAMLGERPTFRQRMMTAATSGQELSVAIEHLDGCDYDLRDLRRLTVGGWLNRPQPAQGSAFVAVVDGVGIGERSRIDCLSASRKAEKGHGLIVDEQVGFVRLRNAESPEHEPFVYVLGDNRVVVAEGLEVEQLQGLLRGSLPGASTGGLGRVASYSDLGAMMFWMGAFEARDPSGTGTSMSESLGATVGVRLGDEGGLVVDARVELPDERVAATARDEMSREFDHLKGMGAMLGVSSQTLDRVTFGSSGSLASVFVPLSASDVDGLMRTLDGGLGAGNAAPPPPVNGP